ncbi:MAG: TadE family protein [Chloroflexota bacterium]
MRPRDEGQALVEFALVLPFLVLFAFAIVLVAEIGVARLALEHAAAEGARVGALTNDDEAIARAVDAAVTPLDPARVRVRIEPGEHDAPRSGDPRGSVITVTLEHAIAVPLGFVGLPQVSVRGSAARVIEWTP